MRAKFCSACERGKGTPRAAVAPKVTAHQREMEARLWTLEDSRVFQVLDSDRGAHRLYQHPLGQIGHPDPALRGEEILERSPEKGKGVEEAGKAQDRGKTQARAQEHHRRGRAFGSKARRRAEDLKPLSGAQGGLFSQRYTLIAPPLAIGCRIAQYCP